MAKVGVWVLLGVCGFSGVAEASPWLMAPGEGSVQVSQVVQTSKTQFSVDGNLEPYPWGGEQLSLDTLVAARFGVSDRVEFAMNLAYKYISYQVDPLCIDQSTPATSPEDYRCPSDPSQGAAYDDLFHLALDVQNAGLSDLWLTTRVAILKGPLRLSIAPLAKFPLFYESPSDLFSGGVDDVTLGSGQIDVGGMAYFGGVLPQYRTFLRGDIGYLHRLGEPGDQVKWVARVGYQFRAGIIFAMGGAGEHTITPGESIGSQGIRIEDDGTLIIEDVMYETDSVNVDFTSIFRPSAQTEILVSVFRVVAGRYVAASSGLSVGLIQRF